MVSGREHEPVAAFFPSIDRNLIRDLDRHLRSAKPLPEPAFAPEPAPEAEPPQPPFAAPARPALRPNIASVVEAVEHAAQTIAAMTTRIEELEGNGEALETANRQLEEQLGEADQMMRALDAKLKAETERANRSEAVSAQQGARVIDLERELSTVHGDLARVTEAITAALGLPEE